MSESQPRQAAPDCTPGDDEDATDSGPSYSGGLDTGVGQDGTRPRLSRLNARRTVRLWVAPIVVTLALLSVQCTLYLGETLRPVANLRHFPIAVINEDAGPTGGLIVNGLVSGLDKDRYDLRVLSHVEARRLLDTAQIYGAVVIPPNFSAKLKAFARNVITPGASTGRSLPSRRTNEPARWAPASPVRRSLGLSPR